MEENKESRYSHMKEIFGDSFKNIQNSKVLIVGAGGIGCELLKNMVLSGFEYIEIIDLDTIDVSNLNRQFLFRQEHVGKSKAMIAKETAYNFNPNCKIISHHGNIKDTKFGAQYFKKFDLVLNALDNIDARKHVNRMCLATNTGNLYIKLFTHYYSGTAGYLGQVVTIQKSKTECYECQPKMSAKTFPVCTIRSNPSTIVHCVVWAKLLFERLYGKENDSNAITSFEGMQKDSNFEISIFDKVFNKDVVELTQLKSNSIWQHGEPKALTIPKDLNVKPSTDFQTTWDLNDNIHIFLTSCVALKKRREQNNDILEFDKDDEDALDFVTSVANLRAFNFHIERKSRFDIKALAGNIVPAISTTNAIISGMLVQESIKVLNDDLKSCKAIHCLRNPSMVKRKPCLVYPISLSGPSSKCYICSSQFINISLNTNTSDLEYLIENILKKQLSLLEPLVTSGSDLVYECGDDIIGEEKEYYDGQLKKKLKDLGIIHNSTLTIEDMLQDINWRITIIHEDIEIDEFKIQGETTIKKTETKKTTTENEVEVLKNAPISLKRDRNDQDLVIINKSKKIEVIDIE
eukprot:gene7973-12438_t